MLTYYLKRKYKLFNTVSINYIEGQVYMVDCWLHIIQPGAPIILDGYPIMLLVCGSKRYGLEGKVNDIKTKKRQGLMTIKIELSHLGWGIWAQRDRFLMGGTHSFYCTEQKHRGQFLFFLQLQCFCCIFAQITISCIPYYYYFKKTMWFLSCYYIQQPEKCWKKKKGSVNSSIHLY